MSPAFLFWTEIRRESCEDVSDEETQKQFKGLATSLFSQDICWSVAENIIKELNCFSRILQSPLNQGENSFLPLFPFLTFDLFKSKSYEILILFFF